MQNQDHFVRRKGSKLYLNGEHFRFAGPNIYWLGLDENVDGVDWPTEFRVQDALDTAVEMGATVVRSHTLGASQGCPKSIMPELGQFNEEALRKVDFAIHEAGKRGLKLIIPFVCNWGYYHGGRETFTNWRGLDHKDEFYTNENVIQDFKAYISYLLHRVNTYSGVMYKEDPTVMAWELGNELNDVPVTWAEEISDFIKSLDPNHLVAHGKQFQLDADKLTIANLDILDVHYYPADAKELLADAEAVQAADKVYMSGEYGWPDCDLKAFLDLAESHDGISGTLFWSLFGHHDRCGYVEHFDGFTVHYPGNDLNPDTKERIQLLREHAYRMTGREVPEEKVPNAPVISAANGWIVFQGVIGAAYYTVERSVKGPEGPWKVIYNQRPADHEMPWSDPGRAQSVRTWYRVKAMNSSGMESEYSTVFEAEPFHS